MINPKLQAIRINSMSAFDAASTLFLVIGGYSTELNPLMSALINYHPLYFVLFKITLTLGATLVCLHFYKRKRRARNILKLMYRVYIALVIWHAVLLVSVFV